MFETESCPDPLSHQKCVPCQGGVEPLKGQDIDELLKQLSEGWQVIDEHHLEKSYKFKNFVQALDFVNKIGALAEEQGHHPDIFLAWGKVKITLWTHKIDGLHKSDFIMAAKIDRIQ
jgi:4a-hydroxytetrahydrobiopterin dehydratase